MSIKLLVRVLDNLTPFQWHCVKFVLALAVFAGVLFVVVNHPVVLGIGALALFAGLVLFALWKVVD